MAPINCLEPGQVYKYLGVDESSGIQHSTMWETLRREYFRRVKMVLRTELYNRNKILAINRFALPVLPNSFGVIHWRTMNLQQLDQWTRKLLSMHSVHHPAADVDWLYAPCTKGGSNRLSRRISLVLWGWTVTFVTALISSCNWYRSVMLGGPLIQSNAWPISLLHSCRGVSLRTTLCRACIVLEQKTYAWSYRRLTENHLWPGKTPTDG